MGDECHVRNGGASQFPRVSRHRLRLHPLIRGHGAECDSSWTSRRRDAVREDPQSEAQGLPHQSVPRFGIHRDRDGHRR